MGCFGIPPHSAIIKGDRQMFQEILAMVLLIIGMLEIVFIIAISKMQKSLLTAKAVS